MIIDHMSPLDDDEYKYTMQAAVMQKFPWAQARYDFILREPRVFPAMFDERLHRYVEACEQLSLGPHAIEFLHRRVPRLSPAYLRFLEGYSLDAGEVNFGTWPDLQIIGPWFSAIMWEVKLLAMISELYFSMTGAEPDMDEVQGRAREKSKFIRKHGLKVVDFGTRRRFSSHVHAMVLWELQDALVGTSNLHFARELGMKPGGTVGHEWYQAHAAIYGYRSANRMAMKNWADVYPNNPGVVLPDTFTTERFARDLVRDFTPGMAMLYAGGRQDSGDPFEMGGAQIDMWEEIGIDPRTKRLVLSDGLDLGTALPLRDHFEGRFREVVFGIGTFLSNDVCLMSGEEARPLNMVIKLTGLKPTPDSDWIDTVKLSDAEGKHTGDPEEIEACKRVLGIRSAEPTANFSDL